MSIICPNCGTKNRSVSKFCIECIKPLPADFAATQVLAPPTSPQQDDEMPAALVAFASAPSVPAAFRSVPSAPSGMAVPAARRGRLGVGIGVGAGLAIFALLLAGTVGWLAAGGQMWHRDPVAATGQAGARVVSGPVAPAGSPADATESAALPEPTPREALAPGETIVPLDSDKPTQAGASAPSAGDAQSPNLPSNDAAQGAAAAPSAAEATPAAHAAASKAAAAKSGRSLFASCEGLGFISASRCKVDVCKAGANQQRKECGPVLAQQRVMEEKRNPTLVN